MMQPGKTLRSQEWLHSSHCRDEGCRCPAGVSLVLLVEGGRLWLVQAYLAGNDGGVVSQALISRDMGDALRSKDS